MKYTYCTAAVVAMTCALGTATTIPQNLRIPINKRGTNDFGLPEDGLRANCVSIGFLPSEGDASSPRYTMAQINSKLGAKSSTYGWYAQIKSSSFDGSQLLAMKEDIISSGAVFVASVMPSVNFNQITPDVASQVAAVMKQFTDAGVEVWLRFAHEMNWYVQDHTYTGTAEDFVTAWRNIYNANCKDNTHVNCFWSPNQASSSDIKPWWPGSEYVDIVGIDCYPRSTDDTSDTGLFEKLYGDFYNTYSAPYNKPFAIGETGAGNGQKEGWLQQLVSQDQSKYPNYVSASWFEFDKEADFRIVMTNDETLKQTQHILFSGRDGSCNGNGNGTAPDTSTPDLSSTPIPKPSATKGPKTQPTCDWGCWGWDCSAAVPCQEPWTCKGGYCK